MKNILLIEDNKEISDSIKEYLEIENYTISQAFRWDDWLDMATDKEYDLILLDLMLPWIDWMRVAEKILQRKQVPIIMITAKGWINDKLEWFQKGALDYIVKPFDLRELQARIEVMLQKGSSWLIDSPVQNSSIHEFDGVKIDMKKRLFIVNWEEVKLTQKEYLILELLLQHKSNPVARTDIIEHLWWWDSLFEWDGKLDVYISNIRKKLSKNLIETIKWYGYKVS